FADVNMQPKGRALAEGIGLAVALARAGVALGGDAPPAGVGEGASEYTAPIGLGLEGDELVLRQLLGFERIVTLKLDQRAGKGPRRQVGIGAVAANARHGDAALERHAGQQSVGARERD